MPSKWIHQRAPNPAARLRLFCFPYAGGTAQIYRRWSELLPAQIDVLAIELPGRGRRFAEPCFTDAAALVDDLLRDLPALLDRPAAFFGHSMGAMLAYELAQQLRQRHGLAPAHLLLSAFPAPHLPDNEPPAHDLPPAEFRRRLETLNGTPREIFEHPELYALMEPILRADFQICHTYERRPRPALAQPLSVFGGLADPSVAKEELEPWHTATSGPFALHMLPGDHFFIHSAEQPLIELVARALAPLLRTMA